MKKEKDVGRVRLLTLMVESAKYLALAGEHEDAVSELQQALERGWLGFVPIAAYQPIFEPLHDDPRFVALEAAMVEKINAEREAFGPEPVDRHVQL